MGCQLLNQSAQLRLQIVYGRYVRDAAEASATDAGCKRVSILKSSCCSSLDTCAAANSFARCGLLFVDFNLSLAVIHRALELLDEEGIHSGVERARLCWDAFAHWLYFGNAAEARRWGWRTYRHLCQVNPNPALRIEVFWPPILCCALLPPSSDVLRSISSIPPPQRRRAPMALLQRRFCPTCGTRRPTLWRRWRGRALPVMRQRRRPLWRR